MELAELAKTYGDFYAPSYVVRVAGSDLMREQAVAWTACKRIGSKR